MTSHAIKLTTLLGIIEPIFYFLLITALSIKKPDYRLNKNYISELSGKDVPHNAYINFSSFILLGVVVILLSFALQENVKKHYLTPLSDLLLMISGTSLILLGFVPADGKISTKYGKWHRWLTGPAAIGIPTAMICYSIIFKKDNRWSKVWPTFSLLLAHLVFITDILLLAKKPKAFLGLVQRLGMGFGLLWLFSTSIKMYSVQQKSLI